MHNGLDPFAMGEKKIHQMKKNIKSLLLEQQNCWHVQQNIH